MASAAGTAAGIQGLTAKSRRGIAANAYGHFSEDGREYRITDWRTPRPWVNVIANPRVGLTVSQTGSGFTWIDNSQLAVITRWQQEFSHDATGKFLYLVDLDTGQAWSLSPAPMFPAYDHYVCRHGLGYTTFETAFAGIRAEWTLLCDADATVELWRLRLTDESRRPRRLALTSYLEWNCGVSPSPRREFHKLFIETEFDASRGAVVASGHMWDVANREYGHWNTSFPYLSAIAGTLAVSAAQGDKAAFTGRCNDLRLPAALPEAQWLPHFGRHEDPIAAMRSSIELPAGGSCEAGFVLAMAASRPELYDLLDRYTDVSAIDAALDRAKASWRDRLATPRVDTPDDAVNFLANDWVRYQAIAGRLWGRCGYYQQSGAFGFRDQLQDSQVWLGLDARRCREQILLHAGHQFADGSVYHWWHPLTEQGHITRMTDDLLWLSFVTAAYLRETGDYSVLQDSAPFLDEGPAPIIEHVRRAFERVFARTSPRGLPYIGAGDWNDGLSAVGLKERGESVWLGHFLAGLLADWAEVYSRLGDHAKSADFARRRTALIAAINTHAWDGGWYTRATLDDGSVLGSSRNRVGRIFLNAQTWAILNDVAPPDRAKLCLDAVRTHLASPAGALLLAPAFDEPVPQIGYITRYAPGLRENGGVYTHAATWAVAAAAKMGDAALVEALLSGITPPNHDPEKYWAEPYVMPGNIDGPESPYAGRGGWTWYTGSAAWYHRIVTHWVLGVRPEWDGLRIAPCLPPSWRGASMTREFRGSHYDIRIDRASGTTGVRMTLDGRELAENFIPADVAAGGRHEVGVVVG